MTDDQERTIDKVLKLLAKAESTTSAEAEALLAKATQLMEREAIDEAMLAAAQGHETDEIGTKRFVFGKTYAKQQQELAFAIGRAFGFRLLQSSDSYAKTRTATWVGWGSDIRRAEVLLTSLLIQQAREAKAFIKPWREANKAACRQDRLLRHYTECDFMTGFASGVQTRLLQVRRETRVDAKASQGDGGTGMELVLVSREKQVDEWYDKRYGKLRRGRSDRSWRTGAHAGRAAGHEAGQRADLGGNRVGGTRGELER